MQNICLNSRTFGCINFITQKGTVLCDNCSLGKQNIIQSRKELDMIDLIKKHHEKNLETKNAKDIFQIEINQLKNELQIEINDKKKLIDIKNNILKQYNQLLEEKNELQNNYDKVLFAYNLEKDENVKLKNSKKDNTEFEDTIIYLNIIREKLLDEKIGLIAKLEHHEIFCPKIELDNKKLILENNLYIVTIENLKKEKEDILTQLYNKI